ncbi:condensation domain-containing protein [Micromonospora sediminicola]|uniref:condensation domain-containing protein n=1 Tax=Micromonospora sediminicola TaxID=946078 RepID=UPI0033FD1038
MSVADVSGALSEKTDRAPLSLHQKFISLFDQGDDAGPFGPQYSVTYAFRVHGQVHTDVLQRALDDVVARHEALRTDIVRDPDDPHQRILPPSPVRLTIRDLTATDTAHRDRTVEDLLDEIENELFSIHEMPLLRAVFGRFDDTDGILILIAHHAAADGWSMQVLMRDVATRYAVRRGFAVADLTPVPQYRDYVAWEHDNDTSAAAQRSRDFWREHYSDALVLPLRTDWPRSAGLPKATSWHRFLIDQDTTTAALDLTRQLRATPFMTFLAAFQLLLHEKTGVTDIVVPMFTPGRAQTRFHNTVGTFHNFLPVRTDLAGATTFRELAERTRKACLAAYSNEIAFIDLLEQVPDLMKRVMSDDHLMVAFQVLGSEHAPETETVGDLTYAEVRRRLESQDQGIDVPDGALWTLDVLPSKEIAGSLGFNNNRWSSRTMTNLVEQFIDILRRCVNEPDAPLTLGRA